jgi:hypothetical protein
VTPSKTLIECSEAKVEYVPPLVCQECLAAPILVNWNRYTEVQDNVTHNEQYSRIQTGSTTGAVSVYASRNGSVSCHTRELSTGCAPTHNATRTVFSLLLLQ